MSRRGLCISDDSPLKWRRSAKRVCFALRSPGSVERLCASRRPSLSLLRIHSCPWPRCWTDPGPLVRSTILRELCSKCLAVWARGVGCCGRHCSRGSFQSLLPTDAGSVESFWGWGVCVLGWVRLRSEDFGCFASIGEWSVVRQGRSGCCNFRIAPLRGPVLGREAAFGRM